MNDEIMAANKKVTIEIDGIRFSDLEGFFDEVQRVFTKDLDWRIGYSLDAFVDILRGGFGIFEDGDQVGLKWKNFSKSKKDFGYSATVSYYKDMLEICHPTNREYVRKKLEEARQEQGPTLLDIIVEIIKDEEFSYIDFSVED